MSGFDVAIVGGGVIGSSIAYHLARRGVRVGVFDLAEPATGPSASWASAGGVRQQNRDPREWPLALEATGRWATLSDELDAEIGYARGGHLHVVESEVALTDLMARVARERDAGMEISIVEGDELRAVAPGLAASVIAGAYTPSDGQANPPRTTRAFAAAAARLGVAYRTGARVERLVAASLYNGSAVQQGPSIPTAPVSLLGGRLVGLLADGERVSADRVVLAAGAWSAGLAETVGLDLPIRVRVPQMILTDPGPPLLHPTITATDRALSLKQLPTGEFFIGGGWPGDVDTDLTVCTTRPESVEGSWATATAILPAVAERRIARSWCGAEAQCFDGVPLIGWAPGVDGLYLALGFSGHGFQLAPAVGRAATDELLGEEIEALAGLRPARMGRRGSEDSRAARVASDTSPHCSMVRPSASRIG